ncbi:MAG TPA: questin oxidase family protein [Stellaceae bacterium]|nr:questin oxidase family protein [Stellaceae bacterium]
MGLTRQNAINGALERLSGVGFTMEPGFAEHGTMVAETISTLGFHDEVLPWVEGAEKNRRHIPAPPASAPIEGGDEGAWRDALGATKRVTDWLGFFRRALAERPWQEVLGSWLPILIPGYAGGLTHGLIRTAHAVRAFPEGAAPSALERDELARGLAYWAATFVQTTGAPDLRGDLAAIDGLAEESDIDTAISRHGACFARILVAHAELKIVPMIQLIHCITAPVSMRDLLPYTQAEERGAVYAHLWRVSASIAARVVRPLAAPPPETAASASTPQDLARRAVENGDDHAIKLTETLLREDRLRPDPIYRVAAEAALQRLKW